MFGLENIPNSCPSALNLQKFFSIIETFFSHSRLKFMSSKKATKIEKNLHRQFDSYLVNVKSTVKIWSIFVAFLENIEL